MTSPQLAGSPAPIERPLGREHVSPRPVEALARLRAGNFRFALGTSRPGRVAPADARPAPHAVVLGCIDPRVPVEAVFDQGIGAICVVRSAGHVLDDAVLGSVEFAVNELRAPLVVVLGHQDCRAIAGAVEALRTGRRPVGARGFLIEQITPAIAGAAAATDKLDQITCEHVLRTAARLRQTLVEPVNAGQVDVVGAFYRLDNGHVEVL